MSRLELKVPPVVLTLGVAGMMWLVSMVTPSLNISMRYRLIVSVVLLAAAAALVASAAILFLRAADDGQSHNAAAEQRSRDCRRLPLHTQPHVPRNGARARRLRRAALEPLRPRSYGGFCRVHEPLSDRARGARPRRQIWSILRSIRAQGSALGLRFKQGVPAGFFVAS